jgi:hypothetical protein
VTRKVLVTLHDVTPRHEAAVDRMLALLASLGVPPVPLLVVPDFHGQWPLDRHPAFAGRLRTWRAAGHELVLHGYWHRELPTDSVHGGLADGLRRGLLTGGEGEFLALDAAAAGARLDDGLAMWERPVWDPPPRGSSLPPGCTTPPSTPSSGKRGFPMDRGPRGTPVRRRLDPPEPGDLLGLPRQDPSAGARGWSAPPWSGSGGPSPCCASPCTPTTSTGQPWRPR